MTADVGNLLFIEDKNDSTKKRPYICLHVFTNEAGIPYNWLVLPITSTTTVGIENLVEVRHHKLNSENSYAKLNNIETISWNDNIEVSRRKFNKKYLTGIIKKLYHDVLVDIKN